MCCCWFFCSDVFLVILAIFFPPLPVWIRRGLCSADGFINIALCCLGYIPGLIHSWYIIARHPEDTVLEYDYESQSYYHANGDSDHHHHHHYHHHDRPNPGAGSGSGDRRVGGYSATSQHTQQNLVVTSPSSISVPSESTNYASQRQPLLQSSQAQYYTQPSGQGSSSQTVATHTRQEPDIVKNPQGPTSSDGLPRSLPPSYDEVIRDTVEHSN